MVGWIELDGLQAMGNRTHQSSNRRTLAAIAAASDDPGDTTPLQVTERRSVTRRMIKEIP